MQFERLFTPVEIGSMTVRNRILSTAHQTGFAKGRLPSNRHRAYWVAKAKGGVGLMINEVTAVHPSAAYGPTFTKLWDDDAIGPFAEIVEAIHAHGAKFLIQLWHPGVQSSAEWHLGSLWAPSGVPTMVSHESAHRMTKDEIRELVGAFAAAALRAKQAGVDGVEIHGAHGYLLNQFMSPYYNKRKDEYGGSVDNRLRLTLEVIDSVRETVGREFVVGVRLSGDEYLEGGLTLDDMRPIAQQLEDTGQLDFINVSFSGLVVAAPMYFPPGSWVHLAAGIKEVVDLPVFCAGRINDPVMAEQILANYQADMVGMTRACLVDPELPNKSREGRLDEIRHCIGTVECISRVANYPLRCSLNAEVGAEDVMDIAVAAERKKIVVVGGGPAGCEAARVASLRGHEVIVFERNQELGGQLLVAARAPGRADMTEPGRYFTHELRRLQVDLKMGCFVTAEELVALKPDVVVLATGAEGGTAQFAGGEDGNVFQAREVLADEVETGQDVILVAEDYGAEGLSCADFLVERGKRVRIVTSALVPGQGIPMVDQMTIYERLRQKGVEFIVTKMVTDWTGGSLGIRDVFNGAEERLGADTVVHALQPQPMNELHWQLNGRVSEVHLIGDAYAPRRLIHATQDGAIVGRLVGLRPKEQAALKKSIEDVLMY
jgi:2,4-dienoyl-CoA reductase-like NADH-dependent reductase (Old Yellow Enzyme family)/ribulose 1,5-bisphosphate synthetase/thiazole synthase